MMSSGLKTHITSGMFDSWSVISSLCGSPSRPVPPLPEARREQAADHAAEAQEVQEPDHPGLQDPGSGLAGHGPGMVWRGIFNITAFCLNSHFKV